MGAIGATKERLLAWAQELEWCGDRRMDPAGGFLIYKLAQLADGDLCAWIHVPTAAGWVRVSERTVQYRLREFEAAGLIRRTGRTHDIEIRPGMVREVPVYQLAPEVEGLGLRVRSGANPAPEDGASGAKSAGLRCKSLHPIRTPQEPTEETDVSSADAGAREALFDRVQGAFPARGLGFTHLDRAWTALWRLLDEGVEGERLVAAAAAYAADRTVKNRDVGLDVWLANGRWRAWAEAGASAAAIVEGGAAPAVWAGPPGLRAALVRRAGSEAAVAGTLDLCGWDEAGQRITPRTTYAHGKLRDWLRGLAEAEGIKLAEPAKVGAAT